MGSRECGLREASGDTTVYEYIAVCGTGELLGGVAETGWWGHCAGLISGELGPVHHRGASLRNQLSVGGAVGGPLLRCRKYGTVRYLNLCCFLLTTFKLVIVVVLLIRAMVLYCRTFQLTAGFWCLALALKLADQRFKPDGL